MQRWMINVTYHSIRSPHSGAILGNLSGDCMYVYLVYWQHISKLYCKHFDYSAVPHLSWSLIVYIKMHWTLYNYSSDHIFYTRQLFLRYKRMRFLSWECWEFWRWYDHFRRFPKTSEVFRRSPKMSEGFRRRPKSAKGEVIGKTRDHEEGIVIYSFYTWFSFLTWVWVNIFLEIVSSKTATTHIFQSGVRNWPSSVSRREIEVFNPQAWDYAEFWQV